MNKWILYLLLILFCLFFKGYGQDISKKKQIPDIPGYMTLKCDFHMHKVFSDGKVWPTVRVAEALKEGLDAIALTDHIDKDKADVDTKDGKNQE